VTRRGRPVAHIEPVSRGRGADAKALLRRHRVDRDWKGDLDAARDQLAVERLP